MCFRYKLNSKFKSHFLAETSSMQTFCTPKKINTGGNHEKMNYCELENKKQQTWY